MSKRSKSKRHFPKKLPVLNLNAAGIDIGSEEHYVAVPEGRDINTVRSFGAFTSDLYALSKWLNECEIDTVVMESTGVYWVPLFEILESEGFEVLLVNAQHAKNVPGRKSDVKDSQWLQQLHTYGLLRGSFQPDNKIRELRTYIRQKDNLIKYASSHILHIQKSLTLMNLKLHNVISDITGKSGMNIIRAIVEGERNPAELVKHCDKRLKSPVEIIKKSLVGNYTEDNIFTLKQAIELYDYYQEKIEECDTHIYKRIKDFESQGDVSQNTIKQQQVKKKQIKINKMTQHEITRLTGVDLARIHGLSTSSILTLISETGLDMSKWKSEKHFTNWLGLSSNNKITGGKVISSSSKKVKNRANDVLRLSAQSLSNSQCYLGGFYRKLRYRKGPKIATMATARKIAVIYYNMLKNGTEYYDYGCEYFEKKSRENNIRYLKSKARELGFDIIEKDPLQHKRVS